MIGSLPLNPFKSPQKPTLHLTFDFYNLKSVTEEQLKVGLTAHFYNLNYNNAQPND